MLCSILHKRFLVGFGVLYAYFKIREMGDDLDEMFYYWLLLSIFVICFVNCHDKSTNSQLANEEFDVLFSFPA